MAEYVRRGRDRVPGLEVVYFAIPPLAEPMPNVMPTDEAYTGTIRHLARKAMRGERLSPPVWSATDGEEVQFKERREDLIKLRLAAKHLTSKPPESSLKRVYLTDTLAATMPSEESGRLIRPQKVAVFDVEDETVTEVVLDEMSPGTSYREMCRLADMEIAAGSDGEFSNPEIVGRHFMYLGLALVSGEGVPPLNKFGLVGLGPQN